MFLDLILMFVHQTLSDLKWAFRIEVSNWVIVGTQKKKKCKMAKTSWQRNDPLKSNYNWLSLQHTFLSIYWVNRFSRLHRIFIARQTSLES